MEVEPNNFSINAVDVGGIRFAYLEADGGGGPIALCLHGFPDSAYTWRYLLPGLAELGFHAIAPFTRGYGPTSLAPDDSYTLADLAADANALHKAFGADARAVIIGHDWGAETAYAAASLCPDRWRAVITIAVPPSGLDYRLLRDPDQRKRFAYLGLLQSPDAPEHVSTRHPHLFQRLWRAWSPGYDPAVDLALLQRSLGTERNLRAALGYYADNPITLPQATVALPWPGPAWPQPTLYLHGRDDGCIGADLVDDVIRFLPDGSRAHVIPEAGHFCHLEQPEIVEHLIRGWIS